ncbi:hypothetical protein SBA4_6980002 [Candidatus Sulfopaludibacter sp. SbA4]|nr:hypothetical protein SBA4_6980002 [Candidatus Sulfopaludibacter sp. SbA4]
MDQRRRRLPHVWAEGKGLLLAAAVKLFQICRLSSGAAAGLAGVPKPYFLSHLGIGIYGTLAGIEGLGARVGSVLRVGRYTSK